MYIPEWEVEETIARNPCLIEVPCNIGGLKLVERQRYLKTLGRYIDLLFKNNDRYVIVEVKANKIDQKLVVTDQVLEYKLGLSKELRIPENKIVCILATPEGFSEEVTEICKQLDVFPVKIDQNRIIEMLPDIKNKIGLTIFSEYKKLLYSKLLKRRDAFIRDSNRVDNALIDELKSVKTWIKSETHDKHAKKKMAQAFIELSDRGPICAHEIETASDGKITNNHDAWFWLFYSVMDRRSNAANFIKAKIALEKQGLFKPHRVVKLIHERNEPVAISTITRILEGSGFPLMYDSVIGKEAQPKSIVDAAKFISKYNYDFDDFYDHHFTINHGDYEATYQSLRKDLQSNIYGAGPRIASQFVRGMVLKGNWKLPLKDDLLLEKCKFNVRFAGPLRLNLIDTEDTYYSDLGMFADQYLDGNRGIISHALWYIRKKYCDKKILCNECTVAGYCRHFLKSNLELRDDQNTSLDIF